MQNTLTRVFLSSTAKDLGDYREAVAEALDGLDGYHCVRMENFGARAYRAADFCRKKVGECQLFVGLVGHLYGSRPPDSEQSYTEIEYEAACDYRKPRLMFVAPKDFNVAADLIDEELERDPQSRRRQRAFRERVLTESVAATSFRTPEELAGLVRQAVHNWEREQEQAVERERDAPPNPSSLVPQTCDRWDQTADFARFFVHNLKSRPGSPQFYVVHGEERENHRSLVERLRLTRLQEWADSRWGDQNAAVAFWDTDWPRGGDLASLEERLKSSLFEKPDPRYQYRPDAEYTPDALRRLLVSSPYRAVVVQHEISTRDWNELTPELVRLYLKFWDGVGADPSVPQVVVFLSVVYPHVEPGRAWEFWRGLRRAYQRRVADARVRRQLLAVSGERGSADGGGCPFVVLDELRCVRPPHVMRWMRDNRIGDDDRHRELECRKVFAGDDGRDAECRPMRDVESRLRKLHRQTVSREFLRGGAGDVN